MQSYKVRIFIQKTFLFAMFDFYHITGKRDCLIFSIGQFDIGAISEQYRRKNASEETLQIRKAMERLKFNVVYVEGWQNGNITEESASAGNCQSDL